MGTKYSSQSASGYNSSPPADDGTVSEANKVKYSTTKTKLTDPVKTLADNINTALTTHFDNGPTALTTNTTLGASHYNKIIQVSGAAVTLTLTDASTLTAGWYCEIVSTDTTNTVTLARATGGDTINETAANVSILPLQHLRVVVNAAANGFIVSTQARHSKAYQTAEPTTFTSTVTANGAVSFNSTVTANGAAVFNSTVSVVGTLTASAAINHAAFTDVASAGTTNIGAAASNNVKITGTTTITAFDTVAAGITRDVRFEGALTLTYNATSLILPTSANITTAADDTATFVSLGSGNWICTKYHRKTGQPLAGAFVYLGSGSASNAATADVTSLMSATYDSYLFIIDRLTTQNAGDNLWLRFSTDNGSTFKSASGDYQYGTTSDTKIVLTPSGTVAANGVLSGYIHLINMNSTDTNEHFAIGHNYINVPGSSVSNISNAVYGASDANMAAAINAIRLLASTGNLTCNWRLYGLGD